MLWGAGRLLIRATRIARAHVGPRVFRFTDSAARTLARTLKARPAASSLAALALVVSFGVTQHPFGSPSVSTHRERARSGTYAAGITPDEPGEASVSLSMPLVRHVAPGSLPPASPDQRHALLVGINNAPGARPLQGAVTDALNVKEALLAYGFPARNITTLLDAQASRNAILGGLETLARQTPATGVAVVVIASHSRQHGGIDQVLAADGKRVDSTEIASRLRSLRSRAWIALPTCFAGGYALPGIVGHNRIATFASSGDSESYELGHAGSYLILDMVRRAMIDRQAPQSVEASFEWAQKTLERTNPNRVPYMSDGIDGDLVLGDLPPVAPPPPPHHRGGNASNGSGTTTAAGAQGASSDRSEPASTPGPQNGGSRTVVSVCGNYQYNCR